MTKLLALSICAVALFGLMSCQDETVSIVDQLKYADTPNWSGTSWRGSVQEDYIVKYVTTGSASASETTRTTILLQESVYDLALNANESFLFTSASTYGANWANDYIPDNWYYSTSAESFSPPEMAATGTKYSNPFINGAFRYYDSLPATEFSIGSETTTYNGQTVYPVTFSATSAAASKAAALVGKVYYECVTSGTYVSLARSTNPVNASTIPYLCPSVESETERTFADNGSVSIEASDDSSIVSDEWYTYNSMFNFANGRIVGPEGTSVYAVLYRGNYLKAIAMAMAMKDSYSSVVFLYQQ